MSTRHVDRSIHRRRLAEAAAAERAREERSARVKRMVFWAITLVALAGVVTTMLVTSRSQTSTDVRKAPDFTLTDTSGAVHSLAQHRGENVVLYFNEGAGCQSCIVQMGEIEKRAAEFSSRGITVLPIVMNTREQILADMNVNGVATPFLLDDGTVSHAYGTLGKGMHEGLPGHSFVLIDKDGNQRWYGEYPSMWLSPDDLLTELTKHL